MAICDLNLFWQKEAEGNLLPAASCLLPLLPPCPRAGYLHASVSLFSLNAERAARATRRIRNVAWGSVCFAPANRRVLSPKFDRVLVGEDMAKGRGEGQCSLA